MIDDSDEGLTPERIAGYAQLAMLLELSASPKPGNVDRCHDHPDIRFGHFLASAVLAYPVFRRAGIGGAGIGELILEAITSWRCWGLPGNTHFGEILLLIPLAIASSRPGSLEKEVRSVLAGSTVQDAIDFYRAFALSGARVSQVGELSLNDSSSEDRIIRENRTLLDLMKLSQGHDLIAREWSNGMSRSFKLAGRLRELVPLHGINDGIVLGFLEALAEEPDSLVAAKFGQLRAGEVSAMARSALEGDDPLDIAGAMDRRLLADDINPGSTADITAAALFIALSSGLRF